jgi:hypothetical protein
MRFNNAWQAANRVVDQIPRTLYGIDCYKEMHKKNWTHRNQGEWAAFFVEMCFNDNLKKDDPIEYILSAPFDLKVQDDDGKTYPGDLKCHQMGQDLWLNDQTRMLEALKKDAKFLLHVLEYSRILDNGFPRSTYLLWMSLKPPVKRASRGYSKMKASVTFVTEKMYEITNENFKYLSPLAQGKNSDLKGSKRNPKFLINHKNEHRFLIASREL